MGRLFSYLSVSELEEHVPRSLDAEKLARDPNSVLVFPAGRLRRDGGGASDHTFELFGHVNICSRLLLNALDRRALAASNNWMQFVVNLDSLGM